MARSYRDGAELRVELVDRSVHPLVPEGTVIALGIGFPAVNEPVPLMLIPGNEYRIREVTGYSDSGDPLWLIERRAGGRGEAE